MPSSSLINQFNQFDDATLEKLLIVGGSILTPMDTELTAVDFASMVNEVFKSNGLADTYFPSWTDRSEADFGRLLVEIFALFSDKDMFYINHFSREAFIGVAELYRSIFHKALNKGINPPSNNSATGNITLIFSAGVEEFVPRGAIVIGNSIDKNLVYLNQAFTIPSSGVDQPVTVQFIHGTLQEDVISFDGYSLVIDTPSVSAGTVKLSIGGTDWTEVDSFLNYSSTDKVFMVFYDEDGRAEIMFGAKGFGQIPNVNDLCTIQYIIGGGYIGDIIANVLDLVMANQITRNLVSFTQYPMLGGQNQLSMEELRQSVIGLTRAQGRIVSVDDVIAFCEQLSFVKRVTSYVTYGYLYVFVLPTAATGYGTSPTLSPTQKTAINNVINPSTDTPLLLGYNTTVDSPIYSAVVVAIDIYVQANTISSGALAQGQGIVNQYLDPQKDNDFGQGVKISSLTSLLLAGVTNSKNVIVTACYILGGSGASDIDFIKQQLVDFPNSSITINIIGGI